MTDHAAGTTTEPIEAVIKRVRAPYDYAYGDSGDAQTDATRLADAYEEVKAQLEGLYAVVDQYRAVHDEPVPPPTTEKVQF